MIAEIHGKISSTGSNLTDRMEDKLTGDFFGNLRYLPYEKGLKLILSEIKICKGNLEEISEKILNERSLFIRDKIEFWPKFRGANAELDLAINLENLFIGIEIKYQSPLSRDNQLLRELKVINGKRNEKKGLLLFISKITGLEEAVEAIKAIGKIEEDSYLLDNVSFAYITWEDIYEIFNHLNLEYYNDYEMLIIDDIIKLLKSKGFEKFKNFKIDKDYNIQDNFFKFDFRIELDFNFQFDIKIKEDFYEFR